MRGRCYWIDPLHQSKAILLKEGRKRKTHLISSLTQGGRAPVENDSDTYDTGVVIGRPLMSAVGNVIRLRRTRS